MHSDTYIKCGRLFRNPKATSEVCVKLTNKLKDYECDAILGIAYGGIVPGYEIAIQLKKPFILTRKTRADSISIARGFHIPEHSKLIVIDDVITTGSSVKMAKVLAEECNSEVSAIGSVVVRNNTALVNSNFELVYLSNPEANIYDPPTCPICEEGVPLREYESNFTRGG